jgi:hypothetical protein
MGSGRCGFQELRELWGLGLNSEVFYTAQREKVNSLFTRFLSLFL